MGKKTLEIDGDMMIKSDFSKRMPGDINGFASM